MRSEPSKIGEITRGIAALLFICVSTGLIGCGQKRETNQPIRTEEPGGSPRSESKVPGAGVSSALQPSASLVDTNRDPLIKLSPLTVPADWKAAVTGRYPKYLEAAQKGEPMPEFDMQYKRLSQVEREYGTNSVNARGIILGDIGDTETPAVAAGLGRLFNVETNVDLKLRILGYLKRMEAVEQQKLLTFTAATKSDQPQSVRKRAVACLGQLKDPSAKIVLQSLIKDSDPAVRQEAEDALEELKAR